MKTFAYVLLIALFGLATSQFIQLQPSEYDDDPTIQESLNFGASHIIRQAVDRGVLPEGEYEVAVVKKVETQVTVNGTDYRFNLEMAGPRDATIDGNVTVTIWIADGKMNVTDYFYSFYYNRYDNGEGETGEVENIGEEEEIISGENEFVWDYYEFENIEGEVGEDIIVEGNMNDLLM